MDYVEESGIFPLLKSRIVPGARVRWGGESCGAELERDSLSIDYDTPSSHTGFTHIICHMHARLLLAQLLKLERISCRIPARNGRYV